MALTPEQRLQRGETPQAVYGNQQQNQQKQQPQSNLLQNILGGLKGFGLGAVQDIAAPAWLGGQEIMHGQSPVAGVGKQANANQLQQYANSNPFASKQQLQGMGGTPLQAAAQVGQDTAGGASWMTPLGAEGMLTRGALGAGQGVLNGVSQPGANTASVGTNTAISAGLNMVNPVLAKTLQSALGRVAFGEGGQKFPDIVKAVGSITGNAKTLENNLYNKTQPIRDSFSDLLANSKGGIPKTAIFGKTTMSGLPDAENPGMIGNILNNVGISSRDAAVEYVKKLQQHLDTLHTQWLTDQGVDGNHILPIIQNHSLPTPLPVMQHFLKDLGGDQKVFQNNSPVGNMARTLYGNLREAIANGTGAPNEYKRLQGLKQASLQIGENMQDSSSKNPLLRMLGSRFERMLVNGSLGVGLGASAVLGHPWTLIPGAAGYAATEPGVASAGISFANSPLGKLLGTMGRRTASSSAGSAMATPQ